VSNDGLPRPFAASQTRETRQPYGPPAPQSPAHGKPPPFAILNHFASDLRIPESQPLGG
jgi:hypothetical protein